MATKKSAPAQDGAALSSYTVLSRLDHDGEVYEPGAQVELTGDQAAALAGLGVVEADGKAQPRPGA